MFEAIICLGVTYNVLTYIYAGCTGSVFYGCYGKYVVGWYIVAGVIVAEELFVQLCKGQCERSRSPVIQVRKLP